MLARNETEEAHRAMRLALTAQVHFKKQVQEWKNILLRGANGADLEQYEHQFHAEARNVQVATAALLRILPEGTSAHEAASAFQRAHRRLAKQYRQGLHLFLEDRTDPFRVDLTVRGIDREPTALLDKVVLGVASWREDRLVDSGQQITHVRRWAYAVQAAVVLAALFFMLWALGNWVYKPVRRGIDLAERVSRGDNSPLEIPGAPGEVGRLVDALQKMQMSLRRMKAETEAYLEQLEQARASAEEAKERAEADERAKAQFLRIVSHELNTPLNGIINNLVLMESGLPASNRESLETAIACSDDLRALVNKMLRFVELDSGRTALKREPIRPRDLMKTLSEHYAEDPRARGLRVAFDVEDDVAPVLVGDRGMLSMVIELIVDNALSFTKEGFVDVRMTKPTRFASGLHVEVRDSGTGIPESQRERIFDRFTQVDESNTREHGGLGLGLALCREHVRLMGGEMELSSSSSDGSTFAFDVPLDKPQTGPGIGGDRRS